jgi:toxin YoeB
MAKRVIWTIDAKQDKKGILEYWYKRNKSKTYPKKLDKLFKEAVNLIAEYPLPRRVTNFQNVFVKIIRDYKIFFSEDEKTVIIIAIWDTRQGPDKLKIKTD